MHGVRNPGDRLSSLLHCLDKGWQLLRELQAWPPKCQESALILWQHNDTDTAMDGADTQAQVQLGTMGTKIAELP